MLQVDLTQTGETIAKDITAQCCRFGTVVSVSVHGAPPAVTWVEMADQKEALELVVRYGAIGVLNSAFIHLEQLQHKRQAIKNS